jgi:hypothetical protein
MPIFIGGKGVPVVPVTGMAGWVVADTTGAVVAEATGAEVAVAGAGVADPQAAVTTITAARAMGSKLFLFMSFLLYYTDKGFLSREKFTRDIQKLMGNSTGS